jgi:hypothetical protein
MARKTMITMDACFFENDFQKFELGINEILKNVPENNQVNKESILYAYKELKTLVEDARKVDNSFN